MTRTVMLLSGIAAVLGVVLVAAIGLIAFRELRLARPAYDDPAVALCEAFLLERSPLLQQQGYKRTAARISGTHVELGYTTSVLNTAPVAHKDGCDFELKDNGFGLRQITPTVSCDKELAAVRQAQQEYGPQDVRSKTALAFAEKCVDRMKAQLAGMLSEFKQTLPLFFTGIYPIDPKTTSLRVN